VQLVKNLFVALSQKDGLWAIHVPIGTRGIIVGSKGSVFEKGSKRILLYHEVLIERYWKSIAWPIIVRKVENRDGPLERYQHLIDIDDEQQCWHVVVGEKVAFGISESFLQNA